MRKGQSRQGVHLQEGISQPCPQESPVQGRGWDSDPVSFPGPAVASWLETEVDPQAVPLDVS